jgi:hypothetical protein
MRAYQLAQTLALEHAKRSSAFSILVDRVQISLAHPDQVSSGFSRKAVSNLTRAAFQHKPLNFL